METVFFAHALAARIEREIATRDSTSSCAASPRRQERTTEAIIFDGGAHSRESPRRVGRGRCVLNSPFLEAVRPAERFGVTAVHKPSACTQHAPRTSAGSHTG